jgi:hypothetical protein
VEKNLRRTTSAKALAATRGDHRSALKSCHTESAASRSWLTPQAAEADMTWAEKMLVKMKRSEKNVASKTVEENRDVEKVMREVQEKHSDRNGLLKRLRYFMYTLDHRSGLEKGKSGSKEYHT